MVLVRVRYKKYCVLHRRESQTVAVTIYTYTDDRLYTDD